MSDCSADAPEAFQRRRPGLLGSLVRLSLLYVLLLVAGGTLINTGQPVAVEAGRLLQTITFVEPSISWANGRGYTHLAQGLQTLADGLPIKSGS